MIKGNRERREQELIDMSYAVINGIGSTFGDSKKFKFINPYEDKKKSSKKNVPDKEQLLKDMEELKAMFNT